MNERHDEKSKATDSVESFTVIVCKVCGERMREYDNCYLGCACKGWGSDVASDYDLGFFDDSRHETIEVMPVRDHRAQVDDLERDLAYWRRQADNWRGAAHRLGDPETVRRTDQQIRDAKRYALQLETRGSMGYRSSGQSERDAATSGDDVSFQSAFQAICEVIESSVPGQKIRIDRLDKEAVGSYFTIWVTRARQHQVDALEAPGGDPTEWLGDTEDLDPLLPRQTLHRALAHGGLADEVSQVLTILGAAGEDPRELGPRLERALEAFRAEATEALDAGE